MSIEEKHWRYVHGDPTFSEYVKSKMKTTDRVIINETKKDYEIISQADYKERLIMKRWNKKK